MNILIVEDETRVADFLSRGLRAELHNVTTVGDGREAIVVAQAHAFDAIILDLMLPGMHGHEVCQTLRADGLTTPILMLSALGDVEDRIKGLRLGADDYLSKPFSFDELIARLEVLHRRSAAPADTCRSRSLADLEFDLDSMKVRHGGVDLKLTAKELAILELLLTTPGKVFSRERILSNVWDVSEDPLTNVVDVYIGRLRKHLRTSGGSVGIETVRGIGFRLAVHAQPEPDGAPVATGD